MKNISNRELPALLRASYEENGDNLEEAARDIETIDTMLGVMKMKSLIASRDRRASSRWSRGRNLHKILENIMEKRI